MSVRDGVTGECSRRAFLVRTLSLVAPVAMAGCSADAGPDEPRRDRRSDLPGTAVDLRQLLAEYFRFADLAGIRAIGRAYNGGFGTDERTMIADLATTVRLVAGVPTIPAAVAVCVEAVRSDFTLRQLTSLGGWQLSTTEGRLSGLVEFLAAG